MPLEKSHLLKGLGVLLRCRHELLFSGMKLRQDMIQLEFRRRFLTFLILIVVLWLSRLMSMAVLMAIMSNISTYPIV